MATTAGALAIAFVIFTATVLGAIVHDGQRSGRTGAAATAVAAAHGAGRGVGESDGRARSGAGGAGAAVGGRGRGPAAGPSGTGPSGTGPSSAGVFAGRPSSGVGGDRDGDRRPPATTTTAASPRGNPPTVPATSPGGNPPRVPATSPARGATSPAGSPGAPSTGSPTSPVFELRNSDGTPVRFNPCAPLHYVTNLVLAPPRAAPMIAAAFARVSEATGLTFVDDGSTSEVPSAARPAYQPARYGDRWAPILVAWSTPALSDLLDGGSRIVGEGLASWFQPVSAPKVYVSGEVAVDAVTALVLPLGFGAGATLGELLLHEIGHVVGLGHSSDPDDIMYPTLLPRAIGAVYGAGDLAGLARLGAAGGCLPVPAP